MGVTTKKQLTVADLEKKMLDLYPHLEPEHPGARSTCLDSDGHLGGAMLDLLRRASPQLVSRHCNFAPIVLGRAKHLGESLEESLSWVF
jgi:hypothetical protein